MSSPDTTHRRVRWATALLVALLALAACGGDDDSDATDTGSDDATTTTAEADDDTPTTEGEDDLGVDDLPTEEELAPALLTADELGEGWSEVPKEDEDDSSLCGLKLTEVLDLPEDSLPNAEISIAQDPDAGPLIAEALGFVPEGRGEEAVQGVRDQLAACDGTQTGGLDATVVELDFGQLGDESALYQVGLSDPANPSDTAEFFISYVRDGDLLITVAGFDLVGGTGQSLVDEWAPAAYEKAAAELL